jgi:competence protein ComEC
VLLYSLAFVAGLSLLFQCRELPSAGQLLALCASLLLFALYVHAPTLNTRSFYTRSLKVCSYFIRISNRVYLRPGGKFDHKHRQTSPSLLTSLAAPGLQHKRSLRSEWQNRSRLARAACHLLIVTVCGFCYAWFYANALLQQRLPESLLQRDVVVEGQVVGAPDQNDRRLRFLFRVSRAQVLSDNADKQIAANDLTTSALVRLNWYGDDAPPLRDGARLQLIVKLRPPTGFLNPGGFDYEKWLFQQKIVATGYVRDTAQASASWQQFQSLQPRSQRWSFDLARSWLTARISAAAGAYEQHGLILALAVGERDDISSEQWQRFIDTGTNHLLAISGLHITLVATVTGLLFSVLWQQVAWLRRTQRQTVVIGAATVAAFVYAAMAGFAIPTQRALIMYAVLACFVLGKRHHRRATALSVALVAVAIWNPLSVLSAGFWMSFAAVAILYLIYSSAPKQGLRERAVTVLRGHILITLGLYPATVLLFQQASLVSPLANFFSVPLVGMVITPVVFVATLVSVISVKLAGYMLLPVAWLLDFLNRLLAVLADLPFAIVRTGEITLPVLLLVIVAVLLAITPFGRQMRWLALPLALPLALAEPGRPPPGGYQVVFLDVGQGSAVVVFTATRTLVYDTGAQFSATFNAADAVIVPYLSTRHVDNLDALVVSHSDGDHSGGVDELLSAMPVAHLWHSQSLHTFVDAYRYSADTERPNTNKVFASESGRPAGDSSSVQAVAVNTQEHWCKAGVTWQWDQVRFEFLHPPPHFKGSDNNLSCVLLLTSASGVRTLLTGDIESEVEALLQGEIVPVDILMAPHHGSLTSSGVEFVQALQPRHVVYTAGYGNRFGFPRPEVVSRYQAVGARQFNTATSGAISFTVGNGLVQVERYRVSNRKIWNRRADDVSAMTATLR